MGSIIGDALSGDWTNFLPDILGGGVTTPFGDFGAGGVLQGAAIQAPQYPLTTYGGGVTSGGGASGMMRRGAGRLRVIRLADGTTAVVRRPRRMNPLNPRALMRAERRMDSFTHWVSRHFRIAHAFPKRKHHRKTYRSRRRRK